MTFTFQYNCTDPLMMQKIEKLVLLFTLALQGFGFPVSPLLRFLEEFRHEMFFFVFQHVFVL